MPIASHTFLVQARVRPVYRTRARPVRPRRGVQRALRPAGLRVQDVKTENSLHWAVLCTAVTC
eukprot:scaffold94260_cov82-Phaeocystis_antarctica.AAC.2